MKYKIIATVSHESFGSAVVHIIPCEGTCRRDALDKLETLDCHKYNLEHYGKTKFKDARGVLHSWVLKEIHDAS